MSTSIITNQSRLHVARQLLESISEVGNSAYYVFQGSHVPSSNSEIPAITDTNRDTFVNVYRDMIQGKRVSTSDVALGIRNIEYVSNTAYSMYDDTVDLTSENFYVIVNASSYYHVYKCLDNNFEASSTVEPNFAHISGSNSYVYQTADGYKWKYMYSVSATQKSKFGTTTIFPVIANTSVEALAVDGSIDTILITDAGQGYDNYILGTFSAADLRINGNTVLYSVSNSGASTVNGFYTDTLLYITDGDGVGQYKTITSYFANSSGKYLVVNSAFSTALASGSVYEIYPRVSIVGDGLQTTSAVARALVNSSASNSIYRVEMLNRGGGYAYATANVIANTSVGVSRDCTVRVIYPPKHGHGYDSAAELFAKYLIFSTKFSNSESNTILVENQFQQIGLMKDPLFANVSLEISDKVGTYEEGEVVYKIKPVRTNQLLTMNTSSPNVSCNTGDFSNQFLAGDRIFFASSDGLNHHLGTISSIVNSSRMVLTSNGGFACTAALAYQPNLSSNGILTSVVNSSMVRVTNVSGVFGADDILLGNTSGAYATINSVSRSGVTKGFDTFVQLFKYEGTITSGEFEENEKVYQNAISVANASLFGVVDVGGSVEIYTSNQTGVFAINASGHTIVGQNSGAIAELTTKYSPELVFGSGEILYVENLDAITRSNTQSETVKIILNF